jgi:predicted acyltransferase
MKRIEAIDQFRGFAILLMILANYLNNVRIIPGWLKHAEGIGYTVIDLIAPMFIFAIGLTVGPSFHRRLDRDGAWLTYQHFIVRNLALLGLGYLITLVWEISGIDPPTVNWGLLQTLGAASLIALPFIVLPAGWRWGIGIGLMAGYQLLLNSFWSELVPTAPHNGPWGALSWGAMLILSTALAELYHDECSPRWYLPAASAGLVVIGLIASFWIPLSKHLVSASYVLLSLGLSGMTFTLFVIIEKKWSYQFPILSDWGRNPLLLYLLHYLILAIYALPPVPKWYLDAPFWLVVIQLGLMIAILSWIGHILNKRKLYVVL